MNPSNPTDHLNEGYYFVNDSNTFFSFKLIHTPSLSIFMIEGNLQSGENATTSQTTTQEMTSMNEAIAFIVQLAHQKTLEGYKLVPKRVQYKELNIKNDNIPEMPLEISSGPEELSSPYNIYSKSPSSQTEYLLVEDNALRSKEKTTSDEFEVIESKESKQNKEDGQQENGSVEIWISSPLVEKSFKIQNLQKKDADLILNEATEYELKYEVIDDNIQVFGNQECIVKFHNWLDDFIKQGLCIQEEVKISQFHNANKEAILNKAKELNIKCDFRYYMMVISGLSENVNELKNYLYQVETSTKEALYPKYWDFKDTNMYSEIEIARACEEFEEITTLMAGTLSKDQVSRLVRIQNNDLMTRYITNITMHQEVSKEKLNRKLLFQDTKQVEPSKIYKKFDTGFDMQYSQEGSMFGKGLYFVQNTVDSNSIEQAKHQLIFADVFVGKSHKGLDFKNTITPPEGYDSVSLGNDLYILSNNFHSCPLYLVEYTMKNEINSLAPALPMQIQDVASMPLEIIDIDYQVFLRESLMNLAASEKKAMSKAASFFEKLKPVSAVPKQGLPNNSVNVDVMNKRSESRQILSGRTENRPAVYNNMLCVLALNRIRRDIQEIQSDKSIDYFFIGQSDETNLSKCIMYILGPSGSAYEGATFKIELTFPDNYPMNPPLVRFESQISHPSIDKAGNICLGILNQWTPAGSLKQIGLIISALLDNPSIEDPLTNDISYEEETCKQELPKDPVNRNVKSTKQSRAERLMELLKKK